MYREKKIIDAWKKRKEKERKKTHSSNMCKPAKIERIITIVQFPCLFFSVYVHVVLSWFSHSSMALQTLYKTPVTGQLMAVTCCQRARKKLLAGIS